MEQDRPELSQPGEAVVCTMLERLQNTMETSLTSLRTELSGLARQVGECKVELEQLRERQTGLRPSPGHRHPSPRSQSPSPRRSPAPVRKISSAGMTGISVTVEEEEMPPEVGKGRVSLKNVMTLNTACSAFWDTLDSSGQGIEQQETLEKAVEKQDMELTYLCIQAGCDIYRPVTENSNLSLYIGKPCIQVILESWPDVRAAELLRRIQDSLNLEWSSRTRSNLLHLASERELNNTLRVLLDQAQVRGCLDELTTAVDFVGYIPVHYAARRLSFKAVEHFIQLKTDLEKGNPQTHETVLAIMGTSVDKNPGDIGKYQDMFRLLRSSGVLTEKFVRKTPINNHGNSSLHYAVAFGSKATVSRGVMETILGLLGGSATFQ